MADIHFLVFKGAQGYYRLEGEGDAQKRVDMSEDEADAQLAQEYMVWTFDRNHEPVAGKGPFSRSEAERVKRLCEETDWDDVGESWHILPVSAEPPLPDLFSDEEHAQMLGESERTAEEIDAMLRRSDARLFAMRLNSFFCSLAMWASRHVMPFSLISLEERVNYLIADSAWKDWLSGNQEFAALWERAGERDV